MRNDENNNNHENRALGRHTSVPVAAVWTVVVFLVSQFSAGTAFILKLNSQIVTIEQLVTSHAESPALHYSMRQWISEELKKYPQEKEIEARLRGIERDMSEVKMDVKSMVRILYAVPIVDDGKKK